MYIRANSTIQLSECFLSHEFQACKTHEIKIAYTGNTHSDIYRGGESTALSFLSATDTIQCWICSRTDEKRKVRKPRSENILEEKLWIYWKRPVDGIISCFLHAEESVGEWNYKTIQCKKYKLGWRKVASQAVLFFAEQEDTKKDDNWIKYWRTIELNKHSFANGRGFYFYHQRKAATELSGRQVLKTLLSKKDV